MTTALTELERALCLLFLEVCHGGGEALERALMVARESGASNALIDELLLLALPYAGVPRALLAFGAWRRIEKGIAAPPDAPDDRRRAGAEAFAFVYPSADRIRADLRALHPTFESAAIEDHYGRILSRSSLPWAIKELVALPVLIALLAVPQAAAHARAAHRAGVSLTAIRESMRLAAGRVPALELDSAIARVERLVGP